MKFNFKSLFIVILCSATGIAGFASPGANSSRNSASAAQFASRHHRGGSAAMTLTPSSVNFSNVPVGIKNSQTIKIANTGNQTLIVSSSNVSGSGYSLSGLKTPLSVGAGRSSTFNVNFKPKSAGTKNGSLVLATTAGNASTATIALTGVGVASTAVLTSTASSLNFNSVPVGSNSQQTVTLINSGNTAVNISTITLTGADFTKSGAAAPMTLTPSQTADVTVTFTPVSAATFNGSVAVSSNAPAVTISLTGSGAGAPGNTHAAVLDWTASTTTTVTGYNVYRGPISGGPYTKLTVSPVGAETFTDSSVQAGQTYFYVVTAVDASGMESIFSGEVSATVPTP
jgi:hypothetical protein